MDRSKELEVLQDISDKVDTRLEKLEQELREQKAKGGRISLSINDVESKGLRAVIQKGIHDGIAERASEIKAAAEDNGRLMSTYEIKTVANISSANLTGDQYHSYLNWTPGMEPTGQFHFRNLVGTVLSQTDYVQFPRANTPIGEGSFGRQTVEGVAKNQVDRDYTMISVELSPMAAYTIVSRQSLRNIVFLQTWLPTTLMNQMEESEDTDFANKLVAAATGSTTTTKTVLPEKLISYMKNLIRAKYNPTAICVDPDVWEDLLCYKPGTESYSLPSPVTVSTDGNIRLLNRPVYPVNWLTGRRIIVGDFSRAAIVQSEGVKFRQTDSHGTTFVQNEVTFLIERTENLCVFRPDAFITTTV